MKSQFLGLSFLLLLVSYQAIGQLITSEPLQANHLNGYQLPPSPEASSVSKYTGEEINYLTGQPNYSISLFEASEGSIKMHVKLAYNGGGVRVRDLSGPYGMSWNLVGIPQITRTVKGRDDFGIK